MAEGKGVYQLINGLAYSAYFKRNEFYGLEPYILEIR
jgi:hypothetical protein